MTSDEQATMERASDEGPIRVQMVIGGESVDAADGQTFDVVNPATGKTIATVPLGGPADVDRLSRPSRLHIQGLGTANTPNETYHKPSFYYNTRDNPPSSLRRPISETLLPLPFTPPDPLLPHHPLPRRRAPRLPRALGPPRTATNTPPDLTPATSTSLLFPPPPPSSPATLPRPTTPTPVLAPRPHPLPHPTPLPPPPRLSRGAVRRLQDVRHRARTRDVRARPLHRDQERLHRPGLIVGTSSSGCRRSNQSRSAIVVVLKAILTTGSGRGQGHDLARLGRRGRCPADDPSLEGDGHHGSLESGVEADDLARLDEEAGFLPGLADGGLVDGLVDFEEAAGLRPCALAGLDPAPDQDDSPASVIGKVVTTSRGLT